ncbi:MAG: hypothetical protein AAFW69_10225 [Pseudomonadota bacterium]
MSGPGRFDPGGAHAAPPPSTEGLQEEELAKIRLWHVLAQSETIIRQTQFADTKAATLLALIGIVATRVAFEIVQASAVEIAVFAVKAAVLSACLIVIMPRVPSRERHRHLFGRERFSWAALAAPGVSDTAYADFAPRAEASEIVASIAMANRDAARILRRKFRWLRVAFALAIADVVLTIAFFLHVLPGT